MCIICDSIYLIDKFTCPIDYRKAYISYKDKMLTTVHKNKILLIEESCQFDKTGAVGGGWYDDFMIHNFKCSKCGQLFELVAETYHGGGHSKKINSFQKSDYLYMKLLSDEDRKNLAIELKNQIEDDLLNKIIKLTMTKDNIEKIEKICQEAYQKYTKGLLSDYYYGRIYSTCMEYEFPR